MHVLHRKPHDLPLAVSAKPPRRWMAKGRMLSCVQQGLAAFINESCYLNAPLVLDFPKYTSQAKMGVGFSVNVARHNHHSTFHALFCMNRSHDSTTSPTESRSQQEYCSIP